MAGGYAVGLAMGAIGAVASTMLGGAVSPQVGALGAIGGALLGFAMEAAFGNSGMYESAAQAITDALFAGAHSLANVLDQIMDAVETRLNPFSGAEFEPLNLDAFDMTPGSDDINGISTTFANIAVFENAPIVPLEMEVVFFRSSGGGGGPILDDYVHSVVDPGLNEPLIIQKIVVA